MDSTCVIFEDYFNKQDSLFLPLKKRYEEYEDVKKGLVNSAHEEANITSNCAAYNFVYIPLVED